MVIKGWTLRNHCGEKGPRERY